MASFKRTGAGCRPQIPLRRRLTGSHDSYDSASTLTGRRLPKEKPYPFLPGVCHRQTVRHAPECTQHMVGVLGGVRTALAGPLRSDLISQLRRCGVDATGPQDSLPLTRPREPFLGSIREAESQGRVPWASQESGSRVAYVQGQDRQGQGEGSPARPCQVHHRLLHCRVGRSKARQPVAR